MKNLPARQETACKAGNPGWIPRSGKCPGEGNSNPLQYSCLENLMDKGVWHLAIETLQARREWQDILKVMKEKNYNPDYCTQQGFHSNMKEKAKALQTSKS